MPRFRLEGSRPCKIFCFALCMSYVKNRFLLVRSSVRSKQLLWFFFFCTVKAKKANKNLQQRTLSGFITIPLFLSMFCITVNYDILSCFFSVNSVK